MATASVRTKKLKKLKQARVRKTAVFFTFIKNVLKWIQIFTSAYAFLNILYWFGIILKLYDSRFLSFVFAPVWNIVANFYTYKPAEKGDDIDFTGFVSAISLIIIAVILKSISEFVAELEENAKINDMQRQERAERLLKAHEQGSLKQKLSKKNYQKELNCEFIFLIDVSIKQMTGFIQEESLSPEEITKIKNNFYASILNNLNMNQVSQKGYYKKKLFLVYKNMNNFDEFIFYTRETLNGLLNEFSRPTLRIDFYVALCEKRVTDDLKVKLDVLDTIDKLGLRNDFICTSSLKELYELLPQKQYDFISKGIYNLSKNLNVANNDEIYSLRSLI